MFTCTLVAILLRAQHAGFLAAAAAANPAAQARRVVNNARPLQIWPTLVVQAQARTNYELVGRVLLGLQAGRSAGYL